MLVLTRMRGLPASFMAEGVSLLLHLLGNAGPLKGLQLTGADDDEKQGSVGLSVPGATALEKFWHDVGWGCAW